LVQPVTSTEALSFNPAWKMPSVIAYQVKTANNRIDDTWKQHLDTSLLYADTKYGPSPINLIGLTPHSTNSGERTYRPLEPSVEVPGEGTIIALDAEFVSVRQPEIAVTSEGNHETIRPTVHALARVSVIRGSGEHEQEPFIDDYIAIKEPIVDYLTSFSGIRQGDLDRKTSKHNLVTLKTAYKKLWVLLNLGCKFLGHGLKQDFRVTNIHIPKSQVIDTIDLFYDKTLGHRRISLAFLAWSLLKEEIQLETHDSIEDARTALKLYRKYLEFQDAGIFKTMLQSVYDKGKVMNWKAPAAIKNDIIQRSETPPIPTDGQQSTAVTPASGPTTPIRRPLGLAPGTGSTFSSGWTPGRGSTLGGSPLR
jgi:PAB-dependent poly(A)-specific ribonuclease subunit 2